MNNETDRLVRSLLIAVENRTRAEAVLSISKSGADASKVKKAQRVERAALTALNRHLKQCIKEHQRQLRELRRDALAEMKTMDKERR